MNPLTDLTQKNWVFYANSVFVKPISLQPYGVHLWYFKLTLFDLLAFIVWNIKDLPHWVATILKLKNHSLWQKLNSFTHCSYSGLAKIKYLVLYILLNESLMLHASRLIWFTHCFPVDYLVILFYINYVLMTLMHYL